MQELPCQNPPLTRIGAASVKVKNEFLVIGGFVPFKGYTMDIIKINPTV